MRITLGSCFSLFLFVALAACSIAWGVDPTPYKQTNLVSDLHGVAKLQDPLLKNPWRDCTFPDRRSILGIEQSHGNHDALPRRCQWEPLRSIAGAPLGDDSGRGRKTIEPDGPNIQWRIEFRHLRWNEYEARAFPPRERRWDGRAWNPSVGSPTPPSTTAKVPIDQSASGASYTGIALANNGASSTVHLANNASGMIDTFDGSFNPVTLAGSVVDPNLPSDLKPFNVQNINGTLYVTYVHDESAPNADEGGVIDRFDLSGQFLGRLATDGALNRPWGLAMSPADFGTFSNALLVGDEGDGRISAFNPVTGQFLGQLSNSNGQVIEIDELWGITFGNGVTAGDKNALYFASGPNDEENGLFGSIRVVPENNSLLLVAFSLPVIVAHLVHRRRVVRSTSH